MPIFFVSKLVDMSVDAPRGFCVGETIEFNGIFKTEVVELPRRPPPCGPLRWFLEGVEVESEPSFRHRFGEAGNYTVSAATERCGEASRSVTIIDDAGRVDIVETDPPMVQGATRLAITAEPRMPEIRARAAIANGAATSEITWTGSITFDARGRCPPAQRPFMRYELPQLTGEQATLDFGGKVRGGHLTFFAGADFSSICGPPRADDAFEGPFIDGTNPQRSDIEAELPHDAMRRIACRESQQRQFDAPPDGGVGPCPLFSTNGSRVGIMQIPDATDDEVWNWRLNVAKGIEIFNDVLVEAREYPNKVRTSEEFNGLVFRFNQRRQQQGLEPLLIRLPNFTTGNFDDDLQQLELDAIRGYNGWFGQDQFGFELHEFRVATQMGDGEEVLFVHNINEQALTGEAVWEQVPAEDRPPNLGDHGDPHYVDSVLAFDIACLPSPTKPPPCPVVSLSVDSSDARTHKIPSILEDPGILSPPARDFMDHFVTVRGTGDIVLRAAISPNASHIRNQLVWEADGAQITVGPDNLTVRTSRNAPSGTKIQMRIRFGNKVCKEFAVWIIWCELSADIDVNHTSTIWPDQSLGIDTIPRLIQGEYSANATIEWTATVRPAEIITDRDRPAILRQVRVRPPGANVDCLVANGTPGASNLDCGVPRDEGPHDATGSGFTGWDLSRQKRRKVMKGNPNRTPSEPLTVSGGNDPDPLDRPISYPINDVEGNDDSDCTTDEDSNPYDLVGIRGTLRSADNPFITLLDAWDFTGQRQPVEGDTYRRTLHFREFVRVQLGRVWYRCSDFGLWRWHMSAQWQNGQWNVETSRPDLLELNNNNFTF